MMNEENATGGKVIVTEDRVKLRTGDRAFNYYSMKPGMIGDMAWADDWFEFLHDDGTKADLNGPRICSIEFATRKGWVK